jgi:hypothetical protein
LDVIHAHLIAYGVWFERKGTSWEKKKHAGGAVSGLIVGLVEATEVDSNRMGRWDETGTLLLMDDGGGPMFFC